MRKQIAMALTGISLCLAMNSNTHAQELFLDGGTAGIGATTPPGNIGVGVFTHNPLPTGFFDVRGDVRLNGTSSGNDGVFFSSPGGEKGMSIVRPSFSNRADVRFDGNNLRLLVGPNSGPPSATSGITISNSQNVGIGVSAPNKKLMLSSSVGNDGIRAIQTGGGYIGLELENQTPGGKFWGVLSLGSSNSQGPGNLLFYNFSNSTSDMIIDGNSGNVGIGTTSPGSDNRLKIEGTTTHTTGALSSMSGLSVSGTINGFSAEVNNNATNIGYNAISSGGTDNYGANFDVNNASDENYGVYANVADGVKNYGAKFRVDNGSDESYGVHSYVTGGNENYGAFHLAENGTYRNYGIWAQGAFGSDLSVGGFFGGTGNLHAQGVSTITSMSSASTMASGTTAKGFSGFITNAEKNYGVNVIVGGGGSATGVENYGVVATANAAIDKSIGAQFGAFDAPNVQGITANAIGNNAVGSQSIGGAFSSVNEGNNWGGNIYARGMVNTGLAVYAECMPNGTYNIGVDAHAASSGASSVGVKGFSELFSSSGTVNIGVWGEANTFNSTTPTYGVYGTYSGGSAVSGPLGSYAGYFSGNVYTTGLYLSSDKKLKKNISEYNGGLEKIKQLKPKTYEFRIDEFKTMNLQDAQEIGFIAQEYEKVFPDMVKNSYQPPVMDSNGNVLEEGVEFKAVNYVSLIPVLVSGIQEQQAIIETQNAKIAELEERLAKLEKGGATNIGSTGTPTVNGAALYQNTPNPFNSHTEIGYKLPQQYTDAKIMVFDMNGRQVRSVPLTGEAEGKVSFYPNELAAGMYMYSLVIDGREIDTKRMILSGR